MSETEMGSDNYLPLFETKRGKGRVIYRLFSATVFVGICLVWSYRFCYIPRKREDGRWVWIGMLGAELWFGFYWVFTQALRWNQVYRCTFKERLSQSELPGVDILVCTADPTLEPPIMVVNTILSVMAYDYPPENLSVYLSDDGGSDLTFYAVLEASGFARFWIPYCKKFKVEPRSPAAYFDSIFNQHKTEEFDAIKKLYEQMKERIETTMKLGRIPEEARSKHKGFSNWDSYTSPRDHDTILQILIDGKDSNATDIDGFPLPTLVYASREKRPHHPHHFKAGAVNTLLRVSSKISNEQIILTLDCDMYSNSSQSVRDALCFFMDEENGHNFAFAQFPQSYDNLTKNDIYSGFQLLFTVEYHGMDGFGGPQYAGTGCFLRRDALCGRKFTKDCRVELKRNYDHKRQQSIQELEEKTKPLASCTYEQNTEWGNEMGLPYGFLSEDTITGLAIQYRGWKSVYLNPKRKAFLGVAPTTLYQSLAQQKRWFEGSFQIFLSKYNPALYVHGKISLGLQLGYFNYLLRAPNCWATLYYCTIPSLCLLKGISLFPQVSSSWFLPFGYVICAVYIYSLVEFLWVDGTTILSWWNDQRMWLYKRTGSCLLAFIDNMFKMLGFTNSTFIVTDKVADEDVTKRYENEIMEFGISSPMFTIFATLAMLNLFCFVGAVKNVVIDNGVLRFCETMPLQIVLCGVLILINLPLYQALFLRNDKGRLPSSLAFKSSGLTLLACISFTFLY